MKNTYKILISAVLSLSMIGCGGQETTKSSVKDEKSPVSIKEDNKQEVNGTNDNSTVSETLTNVFKVPSKEIYVNGPNYQEIEQGFTQLYIVHEQKYCAVTSSIFDTADSLLEAHEISFSLFQQNMANYEGGINSIQIDQEQNLTVNGIDTYYFEGSINYGTDNIHDGYAVGYAFIIDGVPCEIVGSVIDDEQSSVTIQEIKDNVDAMMKSVRTTE